MNIYIAYCGLNCETCEARLATVKNDNELRKKVAAEWSKLNQVEITPEMINCEGCRLDGVKTPFCDSLCQIRQCAMSQKVETLDSFKYMIADDYVPGREYPEKFTAEVIPKNTWAVFPCKGPMQKALQSVNQKIFREWLPQTPDYEIAGMYNIEMYTEASKYPKGTADENYYSEIWIPVKAK